MAGKLTTHVLDTARGCPAAGMAIALWGVEPKSGDRRIIKTVQTNADGRTDGPLLSENSLKVSMYELTFAVGTYFAQYFPDLPHPPFLDEVPLRFGVADPNSHYHIPLLVSPWSYSTYRGS